MEYLALFCRALLVGVFVLSVAGKVGRRGSFAAFRDTLRGLRLVPAGALGPVAAAVVATEALVPPLLALPATATAGFVLSGAALAGFTAVVVRSVVRRDRTPCRCFGASTVPLGLPHLARNVALLAAAAVGALGANTLPHHAGGVATALTAAAVLVLLITRLDDLVELFASDVSR
jgi:hypothetical protein